MALGHLANGDRYVAAPDTPRWQLTVHEPPPASWV
jgi:hypothetical protein